MDQSPATILVLISGIVDPKWPILASNLQDAAAFVALRRTLSPFDASALECALKLRDLRPATSIHAIVVPPSHSLLRAVAAFRLQSVRGLSVTAQALWDAHLLAGSLADEIMSAHIPPDAVLMGREFGDCDEGIVAPCLAETLQWRFVSLAQDAYWAEGAGVTLLRERSEIEERIHCAPPVIASVTNDKRNRLRYPLMKNIAAARKEQFVVSSARAPTGPARIRISSAIDIAVDQQAHACHMISGDVDTQAAELATLLGSYG